MLVFSSSVQERLQLRFHSSNVEHLTEQIQFESNSCLCFSHPTVRIQNRDPKHHNRDPKHALTLQVCFIFVCWVLPRCRWPTLSTEPERIVYWAWMHRVLTEDWTFKLVIHKHMIKHIHIHIYILLHTFGFLQNKTNTEHKSTRYQELVILRTSSSHWIHDV